MKFVFFLKNEVFLFMNYFLTSASGQRSNDRNGLTPSVTQRTLKGKSRYCSMWSVNKSEGVEVILRV